MPKPQHLELQKGQCFIDETFKLAIPDNASKRVKVAAVKFIRRLTNRTGLFVKNGFPVSNKAYPDAKISIHYKRPGQLKLYEDESYELQIINDRVVINAETDLGVIYALETLLQLLDNEQDKYFFQNLNIKDQPAFTWRGLMIDAARHFQPVSVIKRNLDAMLVAKLNTFHWHLSDDQGFRVEIKKYPQLTQKASDGLYYTQAQIKEVVKYAQGRGIRVIPEIDVPGHATAILTAFPGIGSQKMTYQIERNAGIFDPTLDPVNPKTYVVLENIFKELAKLFPFEYIHIGGDENEGKQWDSNPEIAAFKKQKGFKTNHELQTYFNQKLSRILKKYQKKLMGWDEIMTPGMPKTALIHVWRGKEGQRLAKTVKQGYQAVLSNGFYIDLMLPAYTYYQAPVIPKNISLTVEEQKRILGGETTMWSELVTPLTIDSRIWPRTLAIGERFWLNPETTDKRDMYRRMFAQSWHLEELGIAHIKNRGVILRNIADNQDITALEVLTHIYEPLKYYQRNKGGTEYQSYSPFMLFADACSADAKDAISFDFLVEEYIKQKTQDPKRGIIRFLKLWKNNHQDLKALKGNPKLQNLLPMSAALARLSGDVLDLSNNLFKVDQGFIQQLQKDYQAAVIPYNDVELATAPALQKLIGFWLKERGFAWHIK